MDYLSRFGSDKETTVLVYDLGGGTFDLALVALYPKGRTNGDGDYYYDILAVDGLEDVGGGEFDEIMYQLIEQKLQVPLNPSHKAALRAEAEKIKKDLTFDAYASKRQRS